MKKKILYVITKSGWGGAQQYVYELATNLPRAQLEPIVAGGGNGLLFDRLRDAGIRTISVPGLQRDVAILGEIDAASNLLRVFLRERPDIIHLSGSKAGALGAIAAFLFKLWTLNFKSSTVFTVHGWGFNEDRPLLQRALIFTASWIAGLFQNRIILINTPDYAAARRFLPRRKLALIPHGLPPIAFLSREEARLAFSRAIGRGIPDDTILIGAIAELTKNKGLPYLLEALRRIPATSYKLQAVIIGEGEEHPVLQEQIRRAGLRDIVFLVGFVPDAARFLKGLDLFALPSVKEGLPYALMAAMTAGLPSIATRVGGVPDLVTDRVEGLLVPPKDPEALARAISALASSREDRARMEQAARRKIETKFPFRAMIERTISLYTAHVPPSA